MINLGYDWLHSLIPHVLSKVNRVHFGLLRYSTGQTRTHAKCK